MELIVLLETQKHNNFIYHNDFTTILFTEKLSFIYRHSIVSLHSSTDPQSQIVTKYEDDHRRQVTGGKQHVIETKCKRFRENVSIIMRTIGGNKHYCHVYQCNQHILINTLHCLFRIQCIHMMRIHNYRKY